MDNQTLGLLASWNFVKYKGLFYTINTHYSYISYVSKMYEKIVIVSSVVYSDELEDSYNKYCVSIFDNIEIVELPETKSSLNAILHFTKYRETIKTIIPKVDVFYCRTPDPFSWMPALYGHKKTIMHFVGDTIEATKYNIRWSNFKKYVMIAGYLPEWHLTLKAATHSKVFSNGQHIAERLGKHGINAKAVVSSTVSYNNLPINLPELPQKKDEVTILFLSFISYHKGINCLMDLLLNLKRDNVNFIFNIVGKGDMLPELQSFVSKNNLNEKVVFYGFINDREKINKLIESSDIFFFPSLSEGSPRVTIEAMSRGIPVLSTPVASLPYCFNDKETIRFFDFNDSEKACDIIKEYVKDPLPFIKIRDVAFELVKEKYTKEKFLSTVFKYEE